MIETQYNFQPIPQMPDTAAVSDEHLGKASAGLLASAKAYQESQGATEELQRATSAYAQAKSKANQNVRKMAQAIFGTLSVIVYFIGAIAILAFFLQGIPDWAYDISGTGTDAVAASQAQLSDIQTQIDTLPPEYERTEEQDVLAEQFESDKEAVLTTIRAHNQSAAMTMFMLFGFIPSIIMLAIWLFLAGWNSLSYKEQKGLSILGRVAAYTLIASIVTSLLMVLVSNEMILPGLGVVALILLVMLIVPTGGAAGASVFEIIVDKTGDVISISKIK